MTLGTWRALSVTAAPESLLETQILRPHPDSLHHKGCKYDSSQPSQCEVWEALGALLCHLEMTLLPQVSVRAECGMHEMVQCMCR